MTTDLPAGICRYCDGPTGGPRAWACMKCWLVTTGRKEAPMIAPQPKPYLVRLDEDDSAFAWILAVRRQEHRKNLRSNKQGSNMSDLDAHRIGALGAVAFGRMVGLNPVEDCTEAGGIVRTVDLPDGRTVLVKTREKAFRDFIWTPVEDGVTRADLIVLCWLDVQPGQVLIVGALPWGKALGRKETIDLHGYGPRSIVRWQAFDDIRDYFPQEE
jgi:hypothetical protein